MDTEHPGFKLKFGRITQPQHQEARSESRKQGEEWSSPVRFTFISLKGELTDEGFNIGMDGAGSSVQAHVRHATAKVIKARKENRTRKLGR